MWKMKTAQRIFIPSVSSQVQPLLVSQSSWMPRDFKLVKSYNLVQQLGQFVPQLLFYPLVSSSSPSATQTPNVILQKLSKKEYISLAFWNCCQWNSSFNRLPAKSLMRLCRLLQYCSGSKTKRKKKKKAVLLIIYSIWLWEASYVTRKLVSGVFLSPRGEENGNREERVFLPTFAANMIKAKIPFQKCQWQHSRSYHPASNPQPCG